MTSKEDGGAVTVHMVPIKGVIATLPWVHFLPPGIMRTPQVNEVGWVGVKLEVKSASPQDQTIWQNYNAPNFSVEQRFDVDSLARTLAKIAHATCIAELGIDAFEHMLPPYILGEKKELSYLVGGVRRSMEPNETLHEVVWKVSPGTDGWHWVMVEIRLFAQIGGPSALVIVGPATPDLHSRARETANPQEAS